MDKETHQTEVRLSLDEYLKIGGDLNKINVLEYNNSLVSINDTNTVDKFRNKLVSLTWKEGHTTYIPASEITIRVKMTLDNQYIKS